MSKPKGFYLPQLVVRASNSNKLRNELIILEIKYKKIDNYFIIFETTKTLEEFLEKTDVVVGTIEY